MRIPGILLVTLVAATAVRAQEPTPAGIPVVTSWEELRAVPAIDLGDGVKIRLGLEATKVPQWSGTLLYCLTEGYVPTSDPKAIPGLGPVYVDLTYEGEKAACCKLRAGSTKERTAGQHLFVRGIPAGRIGACRVSVTDRRYRELAAADLRIQKGDFHAWSPWLEFGEKPAFPDEGIVTPSFPMIDSLDFVEAGKGRTGRLPTFWPEGDAIKMTIAIDGDEVIVKSETEFFASHPSRHFIARWWVNGKPFQPSATDGIRLFNTSGLDVEKKELRFKFDFRADRLGAKVGDKIGMQVMHLDSEWAYCVDPSLLEVAADRWSKRPAIRLSNRIEFVVQGRHLREVKSP